MAAAVCPARCGKAPLGETPCSPWQAEQTAVATCAPGRGSAVDRISRVLGDQLTWDTGWAWALLVGCGPAGVPGLTPTARQIAVQASIPAAGAWAIGRAM